MKTPGESAYRERMLPTSEDNLCKMMTGLSFEDDPNGVMKKFIEDRKKVSEKYGIPLREKNGNDYIEYCRLLLEIAHKEEVPISLVDKTKLDDRGLAGGLTTEGKIVVPMIDLEKCSNLEAYNWSVKFSHELVHALQRKSDPGMSIEQQEYEAYVLTYLSLAYGSMAKEHGESEERKIYETDRYLFELIKDSCLTYYKKIKIPRDKISWLVDITANN